MPYHLSQDGKTVLDANGKPVPGGAHKAHAEALAHEQAMNINVRREEGKPVAPKLDKGIRVPNGEFDAQKSPVDEQDPNGYVGAEGETAYRDAPKPRGEKASWLADPTDDELYQWLINEDMGQYIPGMFKGAPPYVDREQGDLLADRAFYHHSPERYQYRPARDWNDDTTSLPDMWVRAHPFGSPYQKDAHGEWFDRQTQLYPQLLPKVPVTYYHNYNADGTPNGEPMAIGSTTGDRLLNDGWWHKVHFDNRILNANKEIKARLGKAIERGTLRSSPTVVPDFHKVNDRTGHIDNWLTGSIAVLDANGERQPASPLAIGLPAMKALFKAARIQFPRSLEDKMGKNIQKRAPTLKTRLLKAFMKALGEIDEETPKGESLYHEHDDGTKHEHDGGDRAHHHEGEDMKAVFEDSNPEDAANVPYGLGGTYMTSEFNGPQTDRDRYDGGTNFQKDVQGLANVAGEEKPEAPKPNAVQDPDIRLDWQRQEKAMMKAQIDRLQARSDHADFQAWFGEQLQNGRVVPAEREDLRLGYLQGLADDRQYHPLMKSANGQPVSRLRVFCGSIERRESKFGPTPLTPAQMKALGYQFGGFDQSAEQQTFDDKRRQELLGQSPLGQRILTDEKKK